MTSFPPACLKPLRSGLSVPSTSPYISDDCWNNWSNWSDVVVLQSHVPAGTGGFCWTHVPRYWSTRGNGAPTIVPPFVVVLARPLSGLSGLPANMEPHSGPYQRKSPPVVRGPAMILATTWASWAVIVPQGVLVPISELGSNLHARGSPMTPSTTPSPRESHALIAAAWNALNLHCGRKSP